MKLRISYIIPVLLIAGSLALVTSGPRADSARKTAKAAHEGTSASIPTFSTEDLARTGIFYAGGQYEGEPGKETMGGDAYVEVWVPKQIKHPYPIVYVHGAGQTATDWEQTPDGRPGWAYYFAKQGYVQYMVDSPARGRSPYVPGVRRQSDHPHRSESGRNLHRFGKEGQFPARASAQPISRHGH